MLIDFPFGIIDMAQRCSEVVGNGGEGAASAHFRSGFAPGMSVRAVVCLGAR